MRGCATERRHLAGLNRTMKITLPVPAHPPRKAGLETGPPPERRHLAGLNRTMKITLPVPAHPPRKAGLETGAPALERPTTL